MRENNGDEADNRGTFILDLSSDLHRAIAISDAYYGDPSSVVELYKKTGKPIMIRRYVMGQSEMNSYSIYIEKETATAISINNALLKINLINGVVETLYIFEKECMDFLFYECFKIDNMYFCSPFNSKEIAIFDDARKFVKYISLKDEIGDISAPYFSYIVPFGEKLYFLPINFQGILEFDTTDYTYRIHSGWEKDVGDFTFGKVYPSYLKGRYFIHAGKILIPCMESNAFFEFDMSNHKWKIRKIGQEDNCYINILYDGKRYWLLGYKKAILTVFDNITSLTISLPCESKSQVDIYHWMYDKNGYIYIIPLRENGILKVDKQTLKVTKTSLFNTYFYDCDISVDRFWTVKEFDNKIILFPVFRNTIVFLDLSDGSIREIPMQKHKLILEYFLDNNISNIQIPADTHVSAGAKIHLFTKKEVLG